MGPNGTDLDNFITGRFGEDSVPPEFVKAEELAHFGVEQEIVIDVAPQTSDRTIAATVTKASIASGFVHIETEEIAYTILIPVGTDVYFADTE